MKRIVDHVPTALPRYSPSLVTNRIMRHAVVPSSPTPLPTHREAPDRSQVIGIPLFIQRTPPWNRQDWAEPQHAPTRRPIEETA